MYYSHLRPSPAWRLHLYLPQCHTMLSVPCTTSIWGLPQPDAFTCTSHNVILCSVSHVLQPSEAFPSLTPSPGPPTMSYYAQCPVNMYCSHLRPSPAWHLPLDLPQCHTMLSVLLICTTAIWGLPQPDAFTCTSHNVILCSVSHVLQPSEAFPSLTPSPVPPTMSYYAQCPMYCSHLRPSPAWRLHLYLPQCHTMLGVPCTAAIWGLPQPDTFP